MDKDLFLFRKFLSDEDNVLVKKCYIGAIDKLQTLYPGKRIITYDYRTLGIESDSLYCENGFDIYELGLVNDEIHAMKRQSDQQVLTFCID